METLLEEEEFLASPGRSPSASETLLEQPSPERLDSLSESVTSCDSSHWLHSRRYYEAHDGYHVMEWESFRSCSSIASSANSVHSEDSETMEYHGPQARNLSMGPEELGELRNELKRKLSLERSRHLVSTWTIEKLKLWLLKIDDLLDTKDTKGLILGLGTWRRQRRLKLKHKYILDLQREAGDLADAITRMPTPRPARLRSPQEKLVGQKAILSLIRIRKFVVDDNDDDVHIVGVYGAEGVGKTRIVEELQDHLVKESEGARFDVVIWLNMYERSRSDAGRVQNWIAEKLGSSFKYESEENLQLKVNHRAEILRNTLSSMRFLLVLDGVCKVLDLEEVGIPLPNGSNRCKIVITSRSKVVCESMGVDPPGLLEVLPLNEEESWEMFCDIVGDQESWIGNSMMALVARKLVQDFYPWKYLLMTIGEDLRKVERTATGWRIFSTHQEQLWKQL